MARNTLVVRPVTAETLGDFVRLFQARGAPHYCWCTPHRFRDVGTLENGEKESRMCALVKSGTPVGVLAYEGDESVGWCSVAPRETYVKLERSRTMPRVRDVPTWTVLCLFVPRARRGTGISQSLLAGAVQYARKEGATEIEGYPYDTAGISSTHRGHSSAFAKAGFRQDGESIRWVIADLSRPSSSKAKRER